MDGLGSCNRKDKYEVEVSSVLFPDVLREDFAFSSGGKREVVKGHTCLVGVAGKPI